MSDTQEQIIPPGDLVDGGNKICRVAVRAFFKGHLWPANNLPGNRHRALEAILYNLMRTIDLLDLESADGLALDIWNELRDDLSDALRGIGTSPALAAIADAQQRFNIPKQFLFDPLRGADLWIRKHRFDTFDELESFCSYVGGSTLASAIPILGFVNADYDVAAIQTGKAIMLTQIIANCANDIKANKVFLASEDLNDCEIDTAQIKQKVSNKSFRFLVRRNVARAERWYHEGSHLIQHLDFDGKRSLKALVSYHWKMLMAIKADPERIYSPDGILSRREKLVLKSRHLMGLEETLPVITELSGQH